MKFKKLIFGLLPFLCISLAAFSLTSCKVGHVHSWFEFVKQEATCEDEGRIVYKCLDCSETKFDIVPALGHIEVIDEPVAPTCTTTGLTEGKHCSKCNKIFVAQQVIPALAHTSSDWINDSEPNCTENGSKHKECEVCGNTIETEVIPAHGHIEVIDKAVAPTCTEKGLTEGKHCSICNEILVAQQVVPALGHTSGDWIVDVEPTCTTNGKKHNDCKVCGETIETEDIPALGHTEIIDEAVQPTCTETGLTEGKHCSICNEILVSQQVVEATEKNHNYIDHICSICGYTEGLALSLSSDGQSYKVRDYHGISSTVSIPSSYRGLPVTNIENRAFYGFSSLTSITIPDSVTSIGDSAFRDCTSLTSITIPDSVTSIGRYAFRNCISLTSIIVDENNKVYDSRNNCNAIIETKTNTLIAGCMNSSIPIDVISIGDSAFRDCTSLTSITIPDSVTSIGYSAFCGCTSLTSISIPDSVTNIVYFAFYGCTSLTSITIPDSVTSIDNSIFGGCTSLTSIVVDENNKVYDSRNNCNAVIETATNTLIGGCMTTLIPNSVTSIGEYAFDSCNSLTSITIPDSVTSIGEFAFAYCKLLTSITIPDSVTSIGDSAFRDCTSLTSITIPDIITSIGYSIFRGCTSLTSITIPDSVTSIDDFAFEGCTSLTSITIPDSVTRIDDCIFGGCTSLTSIVVNENNKVYDSRNNCNAVIETATNTLIGGCMTTLIPNSVTSIGYSAFEGCTSLTSITIPDSVTSIGRYAFSHCTSLTSITIPDSVTSIGDFAFEGCTSLTSITIPDSVTSIGYSIFRGCTSLTSIVVDENNKVYDSRNNCNAVIETATNTLIGGCMTTLIPNSVTSIGEYAFEGCTSLTSITIPDSVTSIDDFAFEGCTSLTSITIPDCVTSIGVYAFSTCGKLKEITYNGTFDEWNNITKDKYWDYDSKIIKIICLDGSIGI